MLRKLILDGLTTLAAVTGVACVVSIWQPLYLDSVSSTRFVCIHINRTDFTVVHVAATDPSALSMAADIQQTVVERNLTHAFCVRWRQEDTICAYTRLIPYTETQISIPIWLALVLCAIYPGVSVFVRPLRRWRRKRCGCCTRCGYNLTGNVSGICPECGEQLSDERTRHEQSRAREEADVGRKLMSLAKAPRRKVQSI